MSISVIPAETGKHWLLYSEDPPHELWELCEVVGFVVESGEGNFAIGYLHVNDVMGVGIHFVDHRDRRWHYVQGTESFARAEASAFARAASG